MENYDKTIELKNKLDTDAEKIVNLFNGLVDAIKPAIISVIDAFKEIWDKIGGDTIIYYQKAWEQSHWKYKKKGKRYIRVRRSNDEDISKTFSRKIKHYQKQVQRHLSSK